jgi:phage baseplate assembly protein W
MPFDPQQIYPIDLNASKAVGVNLPFNGPSVFKSNYLTKDAIKNNLINYFLTNPGDRYLNPTFGAGLRAYIFEQVDSGTTDTLLQDISDKISLYFPNVKVESLEVIGIEDTNTIQVNISYSIINTNISDNLQLEL